MNIVSTNPEKQISGVSLSAGSRVGLLPRTLLMAITSAALVGCDAESPRTGAYSAEYRPLQLVSGRKQELEITTHYLLPANPTAMTTVSYRARLNAPEGWAVEGDNWEFSHRLKTTEIGFRETRKVSITVPDDAVPGRHVLTLSISPASGSLQSVELGIQVVAPEK